MEQQPTLFKSAMKYGIPMGGVFSVNFILSTFKNPIINFLTYFIMFFCIYLTYRITCKFRDEHNNGELSYGKGWAFIVLLFFFAAIISSVVKYIYFQFINPDYLAELLNLSLLQLEKLSISEEKININDSLEAILSPINYSLQYLWINTILGALLGVIMAAFTKKEKSIFED